MAAPELRVVRRRKGALTASVSAPGRALVAASAPVEKPADVFKSVNLGRCLDWQKEVWELTDLVGEFRFYVRWRANSCMRVKLVASELDADGNPTGGIAEDNREGARVAERVRQIAGGPLGQAQLIKRATECLSVPGLHWIAILQLPEGERWFVVTRDEMEPGVGRDTVKITLPNGKKHDFNPGAGDSLFKVWNPHPRKASEPDSPARAVLEPMREIVRTTRRICNADLSRLISAGVLLIPSEASLPSQQAPVSANKPEGSPEPPPQGPVSEQLQQQLIKAALTAAEEGEKSLAALVPLVIAGPGEYLDKIKHIKFSDDVTKVAIETRNDAIARLAMGLDMAPEQLLGLGSSSNHWNAFLLKDEDVQVHVSPVMQTICQAIYDNALSNVLAAEGIDPARYTLWFDTSAITADPDLTDEAKDAHDRGAVTSANIRRLSGLPEDSGYDLTTLEGYQELARDKLAAADPAVAAQLMREWMPLLDPSIQRIEFPEPAAPSLPAGRGDSGDDDGGGPDEEPDTEDTADDDERGRSVAASVREDVESPIIELLARRALELASKRRVRTGDGALQARLRGIPVHERHRVMGPVADAEVARLIKDWDRIFDDDFASRCGVDPERVRAAVKRRVMRELTAEVIDGQVV